MKIGIKDFGSYLPYYRYPRPEQGTAWDLKAAGRLLVGERTVANYDEDTATMAVEAALNCFEGMHDPAAIDCLYFASTTAPFAEKSAAALVAAACNLEAVVRAADFGASLRASTAALQAALDAVTAGSANNVLVAAADMRQAQPGSVMESVMGDGAGALLVGRGEDVIAEVVADVHLTQELYDVWRCQGDRYLSFDDEAYTSAKGYQAMVGAALQKLLETAGIAPAELAQVVTYAPDGRNYMVVAKKSPAGKVFNPEPLLMGAGNLGTASVFVQLALVLERARPGDLIALVGYGDGADAYLLRITEAITGRRPRRGVLDWLAAKGTLPSYTMALYFRQHVRGKPLWSAGAEPWTSIPLLQREQRELLGLNAVKCRQCGAVWWPRRPVCYECGTEGDFDWIPLRKRGAVASIIAEWAAPAPVLPNGIAVVDQVDGARITTSVCDADPETIHIGDEVEFCLRIIHQAKNMPHYSWKVRSVRSGE